MVKEDRSNDSKVPMLKRILWFFRGFNSDRYYMYELYKNNPKDYLPDIYKYRTKHINEPYSIILNDKQLFNEVMKDKLPLAKNYGTISNRIIRINGSEVSQDQLFDFIADQETVILKRRNDGGGKGVYRLSVVGDNLDIDGKNSDLHDFLDHLSLKHDYIITEFFSQHNYASKIFPETTNTIRIQTMRDPDNQEIFIAFALHKFGTNRSIPIDNQSRGGIVAGIDVETGIMSKAFIYNNVDRMVWMTSHPDTGAAIEGVRVPDWETIKEKTIEMAESIDYIPYIGWDIAVCDQGICVVEANNHTGIGLQLFSPLYANPRAKRFYEYYFNHIL